MNQGLQITAATAQDLSEALYDLYYKHLNGEDSTGEILLALSLFFKLEKEIQVLKEEKFVVTV